MSATSGGVLVTFTPMPATAQSGARASTRIPATLSPSSRTSFGHLTRAPAPARSATASPARSGSRMSNARRISEAAIAVPGGVTHVRP